MRCGFGSVIFRRHRATPSMHSALRARRAVPRIIFVRRRARRPGGLSTCPLPPERNTTLQRYTPEPAPHSHFAWKRRTSRPVRQRVAEDGEEVAAVRARAGASSPPSACARRAEAETVGGAEEPLAAEAQVLRAVDEGGGEERGRCGIPKRSPWRAVGVSRRPRAREGRKTKRRSVVGERSVEGDARAIAESLSEASAERRAACAREQLVLAGGGEVVRPLNPNRELLSRRAAVHERP